VFQTVGKWVKGTFLHFVVSRVLGPRNTTLKAENVYPNIRSGIGSNLKSEMTSFDVAASVYELNQAANDARIENIYQLNHSTVLLRLHKPNQPTLQLLIEAGKRVHLTSYVSEKPFKPPAFCMVLRKYLRNRKLQEIKQHEFERVVTFRITTRNGDFQLVVELFGEGNITLVNQQGIITIALSYRRMRDRNILRNETFQHAPPSGKNPFQISRTQMDELGNFGKLEVVRALTRFLSIGGVYAEELLLRADIEKNTPCQMLTERQLDCLYTKLKSILSCLLEGRFEPAIILDQGGEIVDVTPIQLNRYKGLERRPHKTFNEALDEYFTQTTQIGRVDVARKEYERELAKHERMLADQRRNIEDLKKAMEENRRIGDFIYAHLGELQLLMQQVLEDKQKGKSWEEIVDWVKAEKREKQTPAVYFDSLDSKHMILNVAVESNVFPIRLNRSVQENAADHYDKMKKAQRKLEGSEKALKETQKRIQELQKQWGLKIEQVSVTAPLKRARKAWYEKFRWFYSSDAFLVVGGRDAITNEILIKKHLEPYDIVFHAEVKGAPFVVVKTEGRTPSEEVIQEAAQFAGSYSRAWREMFNAVDVYWVHPDQVSKIPPLGQILEKGSFVIQGVKNYVRSVPLRMGIGVQMKDEDLVVIGGPAKMVSRQTNFHMELAPGKQLSGALAKQVRGLLAEKAPKSWREKILAIRNEQLQGFVPFGKGEVTLK